LCNSSTHCFCCSGYDCSIPLCAQECQNGGQCVAPDTCQCFQFDNAFYDGRIAGGTPLFQNPDGTPQKTGWVGYDCSVPICVQAEKFVLNVPRGSTVADGLQTFGGHGADSLLKCEDSNTGLTLPRCPQYNYPLTFNDGTTWQTGCGFDPFDTGSGIMVMSVCYYPFSVCIGCCVKYGKSGGETTKARCYRCASESIVRDAYTYYCSAAYTILDDFQTNIDKFRQNGFLDENNNFQECGPYLAPRFYKATNPVQDYGVAQFYHDLLNPEQSNYNFRSNITSNRFLCGVSQWEQGDYVNDAGLGNIIGVGSIHGLQKGRHIRVNTPNIVKDPLTQKFTLGPKIYGEGIYACYNGGTCLSPDTCT
jgi:hypothetical protein